MRDLNIIVNHNLRAIYLKTLIINPKNETKL